MHINKNYLSLEENYLFATVAQKTNAYIKAHPDADIIRLGIGDVTLPLPEAAVMAMKEAAEEMGTKAGFKGYGEYQGYPFLQDAIVTYYKGKGVSLQRDEVFISDGAKSDIGNILDIFSDDNTVLIPDPVYPVYIDTNVMAGRKVTYIAGTAENNFLPLPDAHTQADIIYLCSPNNPTGAVYTKEQLQLWVDYANANDAIILFDAAYEAFVADATLPTSIFEVPGAKTCAIEFCSLSKTAGFTGTRCGYTVIPMALIREEESINKLWLRRQATKFNGVSYVVQRGAEAVFSQEGLAQAKENIAYYMHNANVISEGIKAANIWHVGGQNSPYIWMQCPKGIDSWQYFDFLLENVNVVGTPGAGFGQQGKNYFRLTAFGDHACTKEAVERIVMLAKK